MWCTPNDVRRELRATATELTDDDANEWITTSYYKIISKIGRNGIIDDFVATVNKNNEVVKTFYLYFKPILSVKQVMVNREPVDSANYTVDLDEAKIVFNDDYDLKEKDYVVVYYEPSVLKLWETKLTTFYVLQSLALNTPSDTLDLKLQRLGEEVKDIENIVLSKPKVYTYRDNVIPRAGTLNYGFRGKRWVS